jgi:hypothetical protein
MRHFTLAIAVAAILSTSLSAGALAGGTEFPLLAPQGPVSFDPGLAIPSGNGGGSNVPAYEGIEIKWAEDTSPNLSCYFQNYNEDGSSYGLGFRNKGTGYIPDGSKFMITMPDGTIKIFTVEYDMNPGWGMGIKDLFPNGFPEDWDCNLTFISA